MKKTYSVLALLAAATLLFSCNKENDFESEVNGPVDPEEQVQPGTDEGTTETPAVDGNLLTSFGVTIEGVTKVTVDLGSGDTAIENGDEVLVCNAESSAIYVYNGSAFEVESGETPVTLSSTVGVYYPADEFEVAGSTVKLTMPAAIESSGDFGAINPMAGVITKDGDSYKVTLSNLASVLKVSVTADVNINSVTLDYGTDVNYATGAKFTVDASAKTLTASEASAETSVNVALGTPATTADVVFLLPTLELANGITVTANLAAAHNGGANSFTVANTKTTAPARKTISKMSFYAGLFSGGAGTAGDPYKIAKARDFKYISKYCADGYGSKDADSFLGATYKQTAAISFGKDAEHKADLSAYMIGSASAPFTGTYDGDNKTLSNFTISGTPSGNEGVAPFKAIDAAVLQNISISNAEITGGKFTAGLVGYANGAGLTISGCSISASTISGSGDYGAGGLIGGLYVGTVSSCSGTDLTIGATNTEGSRKYYGGLISYARGTTVISKCSLNGTTTVNGTPAYFGGIVGQTNVDDTVIISDCHNHSDISGVGNFAGGIVGLKNVGSVEGCTNDGSVGGAQYVGGIVARNAGGSVIGCTNEGDITSTTGYAGGIAGDVTGGTIKDCTNESSATFNVSGNYFGGITGSISGGSITASDGKYTENKAAITTTNSTVGGIAGNVQVAISNVKNSAPVTGAYHVGGIAGSVLQNGSIENARVTGDVSGTQNVGGVAGTVGHNANEAITKKIKIVNCHVDGADITASADQGRAGGIAGLVRAGAWIEGCTAFRGTVSGHQDVGGAIGHLWYASSSTHESNRIYVGGNLVAMNVAGLASIQSTARIGGFIGYFQNSAKNYTFVYQNGVVGGSVTAEGCQYVGSFVGYASSSDNKGRIWDSYSLIEDANFHVTTTNANIGGFAGGYNANVNSVRNAHVNTQNTSTATSGITATTVANIRNVQLVHSQGYETPSCNVNGSAYTTTTWSNPDDVNYPVPTILVTYGHYK